LGYGFFSIFSLQRQQKPAFFAIMKKKLFYRHSRLMAGSNRYSLQPAVIKKKKSISA
jgi:hypothetical protein